MSDELIEKQKQADIVLKRELAAQVLGAQRLAEWLFYDVYYDCDNEAVSRLQDRIRVVHEIHGKEALFGVCGYWAMRSYWKISTLYKLNHIPHRPDLVPKQTDEIMAADLPIETKRSNVSAKQFLATMTHSNELLANAIFQVVYEQGLEECTLFMQNVLALAINTENLLQRNS